MVCIKIITPFDKDGYFNISSPAPGVYDMVAAHECFEDMYRDDINVSQDADVDLGALQMKILPYVTKVSKWHTATIPPQSGATDSRTLVGKVIDEAGVSLPEVYIGIYSNDGRKKATYTDIQGNFRFDLPTSDTVVFKAIKANYQPITEYCIFLSANAVTDLGKLIMKPGAFRKVVTDKGIITGIVQDQKSDPLPGAEVIIKSSRRFKKSFDAGGDGNFVFTSLPAGIYSLKILMEGFDAYRITAINIPDDKGAVLIDLGKIFMNIRQYEPPLNECSSRPVVDLSSDAIEYHFCYKYLQFLPLH